MRNASSSKYSRGKPKSEITVFDSPPTIEQANVTYVHVVMERIELIEKLAALVPRPRYHIVHYYGVFITVSLSFQIPLRRNNVHMIRTLKILSPQKTTPGHN